MLKAVRRWLLTSLVFLMGSLFLLGQAQAAQPTAPSFEFSLRPITGTGDGTGDGGSGLNQDYNEYYYGQTFDVNITLNTGTQKTSGGDARFYVPSGYLNCLLNDSVKIFPGVHEMQKTTVGARDYYMITSAYATGGPNDYFVGSGTFAQLKCTVLQPLTTQNDWSQPLLIEWDFTPGLTTDSNITQFQGGDILANVENGYLHLWPDVNSPLVDTLLPSASQTQVLVTHKPTFYFRDINNISGDETGVNLGTLTARYKKSTDSSWTPLIPGWSNRSGIWLSYNNVANHAQGTLAPLAIGSSRHFSYATTYEFCLENGQDLALASQTPAGPNLMAPVCYSFSTEADVDGPAVTPNSHAPQIIGQVDNQISFQLRDVKNIDRNIQGTGIDPSTIAFQVAGIDSAGQNFTLNLTCADGRVSCQPLGQPLESGHYYAYQVVFTPNFLYGQNIDIVTTIHQATDYAGNQLSAPFSWSFRTVDLLPPLLDQVYPASNSAFCVTAASSSAQKQLSFELIDTGVGVDQADVIVRIANDFYQAGGPNQSRISFTGDANHWEVAVDPLIDLASVTNPFAVQIQAQDRSGNRLDPAFIYALVNDCTDCNQGCGADGVCNGICKNDPDCPKCVADAYCDPSCDLLGTPDPDCQASLDCSADGQCNPLCLNDPDCPNGTNCQPSNNNNNNNNCPACVCSNSNQDCAGKNFESCSSCCPETTVVYPDPQIVYQPRYCAPTTPDSGEPAATGEDYFATPSSPLELDLELYGYGLSTLPTENQPNSAADFWWNWLPWWLVIMLTATTCYQGFRRRQLQTALTKETEPTTEA